MTYHRQNWASEPHHLISTRLEINRNYYHDQAEYVKFYENWAKGEGQFSGSEYIEPYETVAKVLTSMAKPSEYVSAYDLFDDS